MKVKAHNLSTNRRLIRKSVSLKTYELKSWYPEEIYVCQKWLSNIYQNWWSLEGLLLSPMGISNLWVKFWPWVLVES